jgi:PKD repeat protein
MGWQLASGSNFLFHVTSPYFTNGIRPNVTISVSSANVPTNGSLTVSYDSTSGMKTVNSQSFGVSDARFAAPNGVDIMLTASNCNPLVDFVAVYASSYLGVAPQLSNPAPLPVASFSVTPTNGVRPLAVTFTDISTGAITNLLWTFGDGQTTNTAAGAVVPHTYSNAGTYTVTLIANGPGGNGTNTQAGSVTVLVPNPPQITGISLSGATALLLQGTGGPTNGGYYYWLRSSTNLALPLTYWSIVATNPFDVQGNFSNQIPLTPGTPQTFYRMQMP